MITRRKLMKNAAATTVAGLDYATAKEEQLTNLKLQRQTPEISVKWFGAKGDGVWDDTAAIRAALAARDQVYFPHGTYLVDPDVGSGKIFLIQNKRQLYISGYGATIKSVAGAGLFGADTFQFRDCNNVIIEGLTIDGNKQNQTGGYSAIAICGGSNIVIRDCNLLNSKLDGIYIRASLPSSESTYPKNILIENVYIDNANRNAISVIGCKKLTIKNSTLVNTAGQAPGAGIDFEPNVSDIFGIEDVVVDGLFVEGNAGRGIIVTGNNPAISGQTPYARNVAFSNIVARNNGVANNATFDGCDFGVFKGENITLDGFIHQGQNYDCYDPALVYIFNSAKNVILTNLYFADFQPTDNSKACVYFDPSSESYRNINNVYSYKCNARVLLLGGLYHANNVLVQDCTGVDSVRTSGAATLRNVLINYSSSMVVDNNGGSIEGVNIINPRDYGIRVRTTNSTIFNVNIINTGTASQAAIWLDVFSNSVLKNLSISDTGGYWDTPANAYLFSSGLASLAGNFVSNCNPSPLSGSVRWDPMSIASGGSSSTTVSLLRANIEDPCVVTHSVPLQGLLSFASVTSSNTATVILFNPTGRAIDLASHIVTVTATK